MSALIPIDFSMTAQRMTIRLVETALIGKITAATHVL